MTRVYPTGYRICRYEYDDWLDDGYCYVKVTGIEYERATLDAFLVAGRRQARRVLERGGLMPENATLKDFGGLIEWDRAHNIADGLLEAMTFRTAQRVVECEAAA